MSLISKKRHEYNHYIDTSVYTSNNTYYNTTIVNHSLQNIYYSISTEILINPFKGLLYNTFKGKNIYFSKIYIKSMRNIYIDAHYTIS